MTQFPNFRQPALGIQDAVMVPAQSVGNLFMQRLAAAEAAFVPTTQTFDSTTSSTTLNSTRASTGGGSLRSLMIPVDTANFVPITPNPSPSFYNGPLYSQFGDQELVAAILGQGSPAGRAILGACGIDFHGGPCGCGCVRELSDPTVIDEENSNGIDDDPAGMMRTGTAQATPVATAAVVNVPVAQNTTAVPVTVSLTPAEAAAAPALQTPNIQYVTYNA